MYRVFLVDDEEITLTQTAEIIPWLENGFTVIGMESDPVRAIERIIKEKPEVVFSDLKMPKMDGHELMRQIHENDLHPEFVMLSAYSNFEDARIFFKQEGFDYLLKPVQVEEVELLLGNLARKLAPKCKMAVSDEDAGEFEPIENENVEALVVYIRENYNTHFTLEELSRQFGISSSYICSLFAKHYNLSLKGLVTKLRMEEAVRLINKKEKSMKNIAISCGYKDYYYFSRVFKGYYGISPTEYKKQKGQ